MTRTFIDSATARVVGLPSYRDRLAPDSAPGRERAASPERYGPDRRDDWTRRLDLLRQTESWIEAHPDRYDALRDALADFPDAAPVFDKLRQDAPLRDADFLIAKRLGYFGLEILDVADDLVAERGGRPPWATRLRRLLETLHPGGTDRPSFHLDEDLDPELAELNERRRQLRETQRERREELESRVVERHGGSFGLDGHYHPEGPADEQLEADERLERHQGSWRLVDERLHELGEALRETTDRLEATERAVRARLADALSDEIDWLEPMFATIARLDVDLAKVRLKWEVAGCWPEWIDSPRKDDSPGDEDAWRLEVEGGREPRTASHLSSLGETIQPVDFEVGETPAVVTGPNMGGKSVLLELVGLCQWAAQHAWPAPADAVAFRPVESIVYVGSEEPDAVDADLGLSSFGREVRRVVDRLETTAPRTLWLLDELARGTHPDEGASIALEVIDQLAERGDAVVSATHFPRLVDAEGIDAWEIGGLEEDDPLETSDEAGSEPDALTGTLRRAMDYQPVRTDGGRVPRDARRVARALGLDLGDADDDRTDE